MSTFKETVFVFDIKHSFCIGVLVSKCVSSCLIAASFFYVIYRLSPKITVYVVIAWITIQWKLLHILRLSLFSPRNTWIIPTFHHSSNQTEWYPYYYYKIEERHCGIKSLVNRQNSSLLTDTDCSVLYQEFWINLMNGMFMSR